MVRTSGYPPHVNRYFDREAFGRELRGQRESLGLSTRDVAGRAQVSQSYVVALEGSRSSRDERGPSPTIDVVLRLAAALQLEPTALVARAVRESGPHILCVAEDSAESLLTSLFATIDDVDTWVTAGERCDPMGRHEHLSLHAGDASAFDAQAVALAIEEELLGLGTTIEGRRLAMVFSEPESILAEATDAILAVEHDWSRMVSNAVWTAGAHPAWNVCVYELAAIQQMTDPLAACLDLIRTHDAVWTARGDALETQDGGQFRLLQHLRPAGMARRQWHEQCERALAHQSA